MNNIFGIFKILSINVSLRTQTKFYFIGYDKLSYNTKKFFFYNFLLQKSHKFQWNNTKQQFKKKIVSNIKSCIDKVV